MAQANHHPGPWYKVLRIVAVLAVIAAVGGVYVWYKAFRTLLRTAFRLGRPEAKQLFAFFLIWGLPDSFRERIRAAIGGIRGPSRLH